jgi:hypothetical protein
VTGVTKTNKEHVTHGPGPTVSRFNSFKMRAIPTFFKFFVHAYGAGKPVRIGTSAAV